MRYKLSQSQAIEIAADYQHLIGKNISNAFNVPIEEVDAEIVNGQWDVILKTYTGDKDELYDLLPHGDLRLSLFTYLQENSIEINLDKYGIILQ